MSSRDVAIVGMACVFPGARDLAGYWHNLVNGVDAVGDLPPGRWPGNREISLPPEHPAHIGCERGGFIPTPYRFDARRHRVMPNVVRDGDPDQFLLLDVLAATLRDAGFEDPSPDEALRARTDLIVGRGGYVSNKMLEVFLRSDGIERIVAFLRDRVPSLGERDLERLAAEMRDGLPPLDPDGMATCIPNLVASRSANRLDLGGSAYTVDAACASSLIAVEHAVARLRDGRADLVLAAGVNFTHVPAFWYLFTRILAISPTGRIRPFDRRADGMLIGEGAGAVALKRVEDAARDGDRVYAVIRGVGSAGDGGAAGVLAPSSGGQVRAVQRAYDDAGVDPATVGFLEAHGTATRAGDEAELSTIAAVFGPPASRHGTRVVGCVKSMIGHTMPAAGIASLIKAALAVSNKVLPPSLHCEQPSDALLATDFFVNRTARPWLQPPTAPRRAGVNAFGFGGVNAHVVLEEVTAAAPSRVLPRPIRPGLRRPAEVLVFAGDDPAEVAGHLRRTAAFLDEDRGPKTLEDLAATLAAEPWRGACRLALVRESAHVPLQDLAAVLRRHATSLDHDGVPAPDAADGTFFVPGGDEPAGRVAALFPGIAFPGLTGEFPEHLLTNCLHFPCVREVFDRLEARDGHPGDPIPTSFLLVPPAHLPPAERARLQARFGLVPAVPDDQGRTPPPAPDERNLAIAGMLANNWASWRLLQELGVPVDMLCGQSLGDVSAVLAAGMVDFEESLPRFWELFDVSLGHAGTGHTAVVGASEERVTPFLAAHPDVHVSLHLSPEMMVVGGPVEQIDALCAALRSERVLAQQLPYPAIHTPALLGLQEEFERAAGDPVPLRPARIAVYSGVLAAPMPDDPDEVLQVLRRNVAEPVRFWQTVRRMYDDGARFLVQIGSGTLAANSRTVLAADDAVCVAMDVAHRDPFTQLVRLAAQLFVHGFDMDLSALFVGRDPTPLPLDAPRPAPEPPAGSVPLTFYWPPLHATGHARGAVEASASAGPEPAATPRFPFLGEVLDHVPGERITTRLVLDLDEHRYLADHVFVGAAEDLKPLSERLPVLPMTMTLEMLAETAACVAPGLGLVAFADVRALRWIAFEDRDRIDLEIRAEVVGRAGGIVTVRTEVRAEDGIVAASARVEFAGRYRETLRFDFVQIEDPQPFPVPAASLYEERFLFHGPAFRCLRHVTERWAGGVAGELEVLPKDGLFTSTTRPALLTDPVLLDGAGQLLGAYFHGQDGYVLPVSVDRIEFLRPPPGSGTRVPARVEFAVVDRSARRVVARMELGDGGGGTWLRIDGWRDVVFGWTHGMLRALRRPRRHPLASERRLVGQPGDAVAVVLRTTELPDLNDEWLARGYLTREELVAYRASGTDARRRRPWLLGRVAAKDALRLRLARGTGSDLLLHPLEIEITNDAAGAPVVARVAGSGVPAGPWPRLSITHTDEGAAAIVSGRRVGIDMQGAAAGTRLVPEQFATPSEIDALRCLETGDPGGDWITRLWCAKEAAAKALGRGLGGRPKIWQAEEASAEGRLLIRPADNGHRVEVWTSRDDGLVLAVATVVED